MASNRFLLIKAAGSDLWENIHQLLTMLLACEITRRVPVVYWNTNSSQPGVMLNNAFDLYFERISPYTANQLMHPKLSYFPPVWEHNNLLREDPHKSKNQYGNIGDLLSSNANVVVNDRFVPVNQLMSGLSRSHPLYGMPPAEIYRYLIHKYLRLKPDIEKEIQVFYDAHLKSSDPVLAVHMPGDFIFGIDAPANELNRLNMHYHAKFHKARTDEFQYDETLQEHAIARLLNPEKGEDPVKAYHPQIKEMIGKYSISKIYLITEREDIIREFKDAYGSMLVYSTPVNNSDTTGNSLNNRDKGIETVKAAYLAAKCGFFIGYGPCGLSQAVLHLKHWSETNIRLFYWMLDKLYNFSLDFVKTGRKAPEEADGKIKLFFQKAGILLKKLFSIFK